MIYKFKNSIIVAFCSYNKCYLKVLQNARTLDLEYANGMFVYGFCIGNAKVAVQVYTVSEFSTNYARLQYFPELS